MAQPTLHPVPDHGAPHRATDHKTHPRRRLGIAGPGQVHDDRATRRPAAPLHCRREVVATGQSGGSGQQRSTDPRVGESGRQLTATLATPRSDDGAPGTGAHAQAEPVSPRAATVVRLERALALGHGCRSPRCSWLGISLLGRSCRDCGRSIIPCRHRRYSVERVPPGAQHRAGSRARTHKHTRRWARDWPEPRRGCRHRQNERLASPHGRHAVTSMMLALAGFLWQGLTLVSVPARAVPEDTQRPAHWWARGGSRECADRFC
jgi:hypothetical protein